ncbi:MAG: PDZ domain-containing protein [Propionibacteriaceae bacterium]|jgi:PDZ domain-containing protein|nr:PDZ domain-containing protein [Propionibacteriaceae bacterium]
MTKHMKTAVTALVLAAAMVLVVLLVPIGFVARGPGEAVDLGTADGSPVVAVQGPQTYQSEGRFFLTTVDQTPADRRLRLLPAIINHLWPDREVMEWGDVYQSGSTTAGVAEHDRELMETAQTRATVAALRRIQLDGSPGAAATGPLVREFVTVNRVQTGGPSDGKLSVGDTMLAIDGQAVFSVAQVVREVRQGNSVGTNLPIMFQRGSATLNQTVTLGQSELGVPTMGVTWEAGYDWWPYLWEVDFDLDPAIGGDAGGLALALALYDRLTPGDLAGGSFVAAAGVIELIDLPAAAPGEPFEQPDPPSDVATLGAVDGIRQRVVAAEAQGVALFLAPRANCSDLAGFESPVQVVPVATFGEAVDVLQRVAAEGSAADVPHC